jgi:hypothetical protein
MSEPRLIVKYQLFRGSLASWEDLFAEAAEFASGISSERVISISHSEDDNEGVVTVWYWDDPGAASA